MLKLIRKTRIFPLPLIKGGTYYCEYFDTDTHDTVIRYETDPLEPINSDQPERLSEGTPKGDATV